MPVCIHNATIRLVRSGPQMAQNASFHFALPYAFWRSERYSPKFWETNPNNWNFGPMNRTNTRVSGRYDKPPLAARCCHVANDNKFSPATDERTDRQTNRRTSTSRKSAAFASGTYNKCWQAQQTPPHAPLQGASTWRIQWHNVTTIARLLRKFHDKSCNRFSRKP